VEEIHSPVSTLPFCRWIVLNSSRISCGRAAQCIRTDNLERDVGWPRRHNSIHLPHDTDTSMPHQRSESGLSVSTPG
jgi:hypothetical protein